MLRAVVRWFARLLGLAPRASGPELSDLAERRRTIQREIDEASRVEEAARAVRSAARSAGLPDGSPDALVRSLREWQRTRTEQMGETDARLDDWQQLQRVVGEQTLDDLEADASSLRSEAESRAAEVNRGELTEALAQRLDDAELAELNGRTSAARRAETLSRLRMREAADRRFEEATLRRGGGIDRTPRCSARDWE